MSAANQKARPAETAIQIVLGAAETLFPGYFALVMATGIVSIACQQLAIPVVPYLLLGVNWIAYTVLWLLTLIRLFRFPARIGEDLSDHRRAPGFFTIVAGTCVLGAPNAAVVNAYAAATVLWFGGLGLWFLVMYAFFTAVTASTRKPPLASSLSGAWLIAAVATQSIALLIAVLFATLPPAPEIQLLCLAMFMAGCMLYLSIIPLISYRLTFLRFTPQDFSPPYWINMGAAAISALAGLELLQRARGWPVLRDFGPFLEGFAVFFWAAASWWIPFLAALSVWRYVLRKDKLLYEPRVWGMVFPLGMYAAATFELSRALDLPFLAVLARIFVFAALPRWSHGFSPSQPCSSKLCVLPC
jgi:tellurite resistance protein TehA-like permease